MVGGIKQPWIVATIACAVAWTVLLGALALARFDGDARGFLLAGAEFTRPPVLAEVPTLSPYGYDGQFYAVLATDPLLLHPDTAQYLDTPAYRAARVGGPLLAWLSAFGQPAVAVWTYLLWCWAGALALVGLLARWLREVGVSPWWAIAVGVSGGVAAAVLRATPDALAVALAVAGLMARSRSRHGLAVGLLGTATLTRETMVAAALAAAVVELAEKRWRWAALYGLLPAAVYGGWRLFLSFRLGGALLEGSGNLGPPLGWVGAKVWHLTHGGAGGMGMEVWGTLAILAGLGGAVVLVRHSLREATAAAYLLFAALSLLLSSQVTVEAYAYARVLLPLPVLGLLAAAGSSYLARLWLYFLAAFQALVGLAMVRVELGATFPALANLKGYLFS